MASNDREAAARARFESLWEVHHRDVFAYAFRRLGEEQAASDAAAEAFLVAWRRLDRVPENALPWLLGVARRVVANQRRGERRRLALSTRLAADWEELVIADDEAAGPVAAAFNQLRTRDREVLSLIAWEGLKPREAATVLGMTPARFSVRLHRAKRRLQREIEVLGGGDGGAPTDASNPGQAEANVRLET
jgi:RNA polymerase sigma factor (sigma-70 family)